MFNIIVSAIQTSQLVPSFNSTFMIERNLLNLIFASKYIHYITVCVPTLRHNNKLLLHYAIKWYIPFRLRKLCCLHWLKIWPRVGTSTVFGLITTQFWTAVGQLPVRFRSHLKSHFLRAYLKSNNVNLANWKAIFGIRLRWLSERCSWVISGISPHISMQESKLISVIIFPFKLRICNDGNIIKLVQLTTISNLKPIMI